MNSGTVAVISTVMMELMDKTRVHEYLLVHVLGIRISRMNVCVYTTLAIGARSDQRVGSHSFVVHQVSFT